MAHRRELARTVAKLVLFFGVCTLLTAYLAFTIGNIHLFQHTYKLAATFDDVTGMTRDDNVKVAGVIVGKVTKVKIDQGRARVTFTVRQNVKLPTDSSVAVRWRNLLGQRYLYLYPGSASTVLRDGDSVHNTRSVVDIGELFNRLGPIVRTIDPKQVNTFLDSITEALDGNQVKLRQSIDDLATVAGSLASRDQAIGHLITNLDNVTGAINSRDAQIRTVLDNLVQIAQSFSANTGVLDTAVHDLGDFSDQFGTLLNNNRTQIDSIVGSLNTLTDEVKLKLPQVDHALGGLDQAAKRLFNASRYGEWLNQDVPCGTIGKDPPARISVNSPCITDGHTAGVTPGPSPGAPGSSSAASAPAPTRGVAALTQLLSPPQ